MDGTRIEEAKFPSWWQDECIPDEAIYSSHRLHEVATGRRQQIQGIQMRDNLVLTAIQKMYSAVLLPRLLSDVPPMVSLTLEVW